MAQVVDINRVIPRLSRERVSILKMADVLFLQGQIEPLQVTAEGDYYVVFDCDPWANEIVHAAHEMGWNTLLVVITEVYEQ